MYELYRKKGTTPMRPYLALEPMTHISVSEGDVVETGGMVAHDPDNPSDQWYISKDYFEKNYEEA